MLNLREILEQEHSKLITQKVALEIIQYPENLNHLVNFIEKENSIVSQRAAWPISIVAETNSEILSPYLTRLVNQLFDETKHPAIKRNILRAFQYIPEFTEEIEGKLIDRCFILLNSTTEPIAIRVFSMQVVFNLSKKYPEIKHELKESILIQFDNQSAGFKSRGKRILSQLEK